MCSSDLAQRWAPQVPQTQRREVGKAETRAPLRAHRSSPPAPAPCSSTAPGSDRDDSDSSSSSSSRVLSVRQAPR